MPNSHDLPNFPETVVLFFHKNQGFFLQKSSIFSITQGVCLKILFFRKIEFGCQRINPGPIDLKLFFIEVFIILLALRFGKRSFKRSNQEQPPDSIRSLVEVLRGLDTFDKNKMSYL